MAKNRSNSLIIIVVIALMGLVFVIAFD